MATVFSHPLSMGGTGAGHYEGNPETYMNVGEAMGKAMVGLLKKQDGKSLMKKRTLPEAVRHHELT